MAETVENPGITPTNLYPMLQAFMRHMAAKGQPFTETSIGKTIFGDPMMMFGLRNGREPRMRTVDRAVGAVEKLAPGFAAEFLKGAA